MLNNSVGGGKSSEGGPGVGGWGTLEALLVSMGLTVIVYVVDHHIGRKKSPKHFCLTRMTSFRPCLVSINGKPTVSAF